MRVFLSFFRFLKNIFYPSHRQISALPKAAILLLGGVGLFFALSFFLPFQHVQQAPVLTELYGKPIRVILPRGPQTLNPRRALDSSSELISQLLFTGLTSWNADLSLAPGLADDWSRNENATEWRFQLRADQKDHLGNSITPRDIFTCLENYRDNTSQAPISHLLSRWEANFLEGDQLTLILKEPDPFLPQKIARFGFFRTQKEEGEAVRVCAEPLADEVLIGSGPYGPLSGRISRLKPETSLELYPKNHSALAPSPLNPLELLFIRDESTRAFMLLRGDANAAWNSFSPTRTQWFKKKMGARFDVLEQSGLHISYLAFNLKHPALSHSTVRQAIAHSIDRRKITTTRLSSCCNVAGSFLPPLLPGSHQPELRYDPILAETLLERAGLLKDENEIRLTLRYKTTPRQESIEMARIFQHFLAQVGIKIQIEIVEPAIFFSSLGKGDFDLFSSRWLGVQEPSTLFHALHSKGKRNRSRYSSQAMDQSLDAALQTIDTEKQNEHLFQIQDQMMTDLPYLPLWFWNNALVLQKGLTGVLPEELSVRGDLLPLGRLKHLQSTSN
jgi:peptide/nickel transport system substrate-binding protein